MHEDESNYKIDVIWLNEHLLFTFRLFHAIYLIRVFITIILKSLDELLYTDFS